MMKIKITLLTILSLTLPMHGMNPDDAQLPPTQETFSDGNNEPLVQDYFCYPNDMAPELWISTAQPTNFVTAGEPTSFVTSQELWQLLFTTDGQLPKVDYLTTKKILLNIYRTALLTASCIGKLASVCRAISTNNGITLAERDTLFTSALERYRLFKRQTPSYLLLKHLELDPYQYSDQHWNLLTMLIEFQILKPSDIIPDDLD